MKIHLILSGKGGVGKSTVAVNLALALCASGKRVGILDVDLTGPSIPKLLRVENKIVLQAKDGWVPVYVDTKKLLGVMSIQFLLKNKDDAIVWRGPKKSAMIKQFLNDVIWGSIDHLIIDTPPGTSDEHISLVEYLQGLPLEGAIIVTTRMKFCCILKYIYLAQAVSLSDVRKEMNFCEKVKIAVTGVIENMSGFICLHCSECTDIFSKGGGEAMAKDFKVPFLGFSLNF
jgi:Mrp family chromosome partitioning ATPase